MAYFILAAGVLLIIYGALGLKISAAGEEKTPGSSYNFDDMLSDRIILEKLNSIEYKIDNLCMVPEVSQDSSDKGILVKEDNINTRISSMAEQGYTVEEICGKFGMLKGEVLLRLGMKE